MKITITWYKLLAVVLALMVLTAGATAWSCGQFSNLADVYAKLQLVDELIEENYLYLDELNWTDLEDGAATGMVAALDDQYAAYYPVEDYADKLQSDDGSLVGIGVGVYLETDGNLVVYEVYDGAPADEAGLQIGDVIIAVDGALLTDIGADTGVEMIQGEEGTTVEITLQRDDQTLTLDIQRAKVSLPSVSWTMIDDIAYVAIDDFTVETVTQFETAMTALQEAGAVGVVFDLRDNGGGLLDSAVSMLDLLLPEGVLVTIVDMDGNETVRGESDESCIELPMICLTNESTGSASELFVQALKDYDWATSVGTVTYGKGVMQTTYGLEDGTAVKLTTAYYNPPSGINYNGIGVIPDVEVTIEDLETYVKGDIDYDEQLATAVLLLQSEG